MTKESHEQSPNKFDTLTLQSAVNALSESNNVTIFGQVLDILVFFTELTPSDKNMYLYKPGK